MGTLKSILARHMRKEVVFAILAGISIGLIAAFGTWRISKLVKTGPKTVIKKESPAPVKVTSISVENFNDFDVFTDDPTIKGLTTPNSDIVVSTTDKDFYTKSNFDGVFEITIELPAGLSRVMINDKKFIVVYSTEVERGSTSFVGTVTDISSGTIQIKPDKGGILQTSVDENTKYINGLKKNIEIKQSDLAIGDFIVAIGRTNGNGAVMNSKVLKTERILITSPLSENKIEVEKIEIEKLSKTMINDIKLSKKWNGPDIDDLNIGQEIYIIGTRVDDKNYTLRTIFIPQI